MSDPLEDLAVAREDADVLQQQLARVEEQIGPVEAIDESGSIVAKLDGDGNVEAIQVGAQWRLKLRPSQVAGAIGEAITLAKTARFEAWGNAYSAVDDEPPPRARPTGAADALARHLQELADRSDGAPEVAIGAADAVLTDLLEGLTEANDILDQHADARFHGRSSAGHARAIVSGNGEFLSIEFDDTWLGRAHEVNVGRESTQAIQNATLQARERGLRALLETTRLAQVARLATDPNAPHTYWK